MLARHQSGKDVHSALHDDVVVVSLAETRGAYFQYLEAPAGNAVVALQHFQGKDSVSDGLHLALWVVAKALVEKQRGAVLGAADKAASVGGENPSPSVA